MTESRILQPAKAAFKNEGHIKSLSDQSDGLFPAAPLYRAAEGRLWAEGGLHQVGAGLGRRDAEDTGSRVRVGMEDGRNNDQCGPHE